MKRKLFLLLCALLTMIGVQAQVDVTSTYITNADFSSTDGWTQTHSTEYWTLGNGVIGTYAVANSKTSTTDATHLATEYCFGIQCRWSTNYAQFTQTATLPAGNYILAYDVENTNNGTTFSNSYNNLFYVQVGETKYEDTSVEWMMGERGWTQHIISFSLASESSVTISLGYGTGSNNYGSTSTPHLYVSHLELIHSASNALDYTSKITNNSFEDGDTGWTHGSSSDTGVFTPDGNHATEGADGSKIFNTWWQGVPITQEITEIPNGKYVIKASLASSDANADAKLFLLGPTASEHSDVITIYKGTSGVFHDYAYEVLVTSKKITVGAVGGTDAGEYVTGGHWWYKADNFRLYFLGEDLSMYETPFANAQAYAKGVNQESPMNASVLSALQTAITAYGDKEFSTFETSDDIIAAIDDLNGSANNAKASISNYEKAADIINAASVLDAAGQASYAVNENVSAVKSAYDDRTLEAVTSEQEAACHTALVAATKVQTTAGSDWTSLITNPSFEENTAAYAEPIGWTLSGTAAGIQTQNNTGFDGYRVGTMFGERWSNSTIGDFDAYQTIEGMPSGVYELKAVATFNGTGGYLYANDVKVNVTDAKYYTVQIALDANSTLRFGVKNETSGNGSWFKCDDFTLKLVSAGLPDVEAVTGKMNAAVATAQTNAIETYEANRTIANYNTAVAAIAAAQSSKDAYTAGKSALNKVENILANTNVYTEEAFTTFNGAYTTAADKYDNGTWTSEEAQAYGNTVFGTGWRANATIDDFLISAWDVEPRTWDSYHVNTWSTTDDSGNPNLVTPCFEYWTGDDTTLADKTMTATLSDFDTNATYKVSATICVGVNTGVEASTAPIGVTLQLNDGSTVSATGSRIGETRFYEGTFEANAVVGADGKLVIKLNVASTNASWVTWRNVKYTKISDAPANVSVTIGEAGYSTFGSQYPLDLANLPAGLEAFKATGIRSGDQETTYIVFQSLNSAVAANTGLLLKGTAGEEYDIPVATSGEAVDGNLLFVNAGGNMFDAEVGYDYYGLKKNTKEFAPFLPGSVAIPADKAYLKLDDAVIGGARESLLINFDEFTAINTIEAVDGEAGTLKDGKYLESGKIVIVKNGVKYSANGQILK